MIHKKGTENGKEKDKTRDHFYGEKVCRGGGGGGGVGVITFLGRILKKKKYQNV